ncbi:MAG: MBL fold metallo-hydrolase [Chloroflexota bacterium]
MLVAPGVRRLLAPNPSPLTGDGTNTYLVGDREVAVIDPGPALAPHLEAILAEVASCQGHIAALLVSHAHQDHLPAAYLLRERTGAPILAHASIPGHDRALVDGEPATAGSADFIAFETPGHAREHLCFWLEAPRLLFTGDLVAGAGTVVLSEGAGALAAYLSSLRRMAALGRSTILPGHGPVVPDGLGRIEEYLTHRADRDRQILKILRDGPASVDTLVRRIYRETPPTLRAMATRNVRAHLERLADQGNVKAQGNVWSLGSPD